jgi:hypothetical protein
MEVIPLNSEPSYSAPLKLIFRITIIKQFHDEEMMMPTIQTEKF